MFIDVIKEMIDGYTLPRLNDDEIRELNDELVIYLPEYVLDIFENG